MPGIGWRESLVEAERDVRGTAKRILMFFHHPQCGGCRKSKEITFKDPAVIELVDRLFSPVSFQVTEAQNMTARYKVEWTPTFVITDPDGVELERWVGYLPPVEFIDQIYLSEGHAEFHRNRFNEARKDFSWIVKNHPEAYVAPEARYYLGVSLYKESGDPAHLKETWETMNERWPGNYWTKKASAWS